MSIHDDNITLEDLDFAAEKGFNRGIEYVAVRMLKENMDIKIIAKLTGLSVTKLQERGIEYVAVRMLKENMDIKIIAKLTGLSVTKLQELADGV